MRGSKRPRSQLDPTGLRTWELRVPSGVRDPVTGRARYNTRTFHGTEAAADTALAGLVTETMTSRRTGVAAVAPGATFGWLLDEWLAAKWAVRKATTVAGYEDKARLHVRPFIPPGARRALNDTPLCDLGVAHFAALYEHLARSGASPAQINQVHSVCRGAINWARKRGWWSGANPTVATERPALKRRTKTLVPRPEPVFALLRALDEFDPDMAVALWFTSSVGTRRSMALALRWCDIDFEAMTVDLIGATTAVRGRIHTVWSNKENKDHTVCLDPYTIEMLTRHRARCVERAQAAGLELRPNSFVFSFKPDGSAPMHPDTLTKTWRKHADAAGLHRARLHDLRHMVATSLLRAGVPVEVVSKRLGHAKVSITQDMYSHVFDELGGREAADVMGALMTGADPDKIRRKAAKKARRRAAKATATVVDLSAYRSA